MINNLKNWVIISLLITNLLGITTAYYQGKTVGESELRQYYIEVEQANNAYWQAKIYRLNESAEQYRIKTQSKFEGLQNEFIQKSNDLVLCQYNADQLRHIKTAANMQITTSSKLGTTARAGISTNIESRERYSCQDAGVTMIAWSQQYFSCKSKLDYLQGLWLGSQ